MNMIHDYSLKVTYDQLAVANSIISTTKVQNKDYAEVNQRIKAFRFLYPQGFITTNVESIQDGVCVMTAQVGYYEDGKPVVLGTGTAYEKENSSFINKTSYIENCETSAVGRALGMAGIGIDISVASAEEEISGENGFSRVLPLLPKIDVAIVGEPTGMQPAIAEKGLMVIDGYAHGKSGHAARNEGLNAIYEALDDLVWIRDYKFRKVSPLLGPTKMTVTVVEGGTQHNVIPDTLHFIIDVRTNEFYQNEYLFNFLCKKMTKCELRARSFRLHSSSISPDHPIVKRCIKRGMQPFGSPTLSDQALMPFPSLKLGPGESSRSHSADEFIKISEIDYAIRTYVELLENRLSI